MASGQWVRLALRSLAKAGGVSEIAGYLGGASSGRHHRRHLMTAAQYRRARAKAFRIWRQETCVQIAA